MSEKYVDFISNVDFENAVKNVVLKYEKLKKELTTKEFFKNQVDPIKFLFDQKVFNQSDETKIEAEVARKLDKSVTNYIGEFHEELLGKIKGYTKYDIGYGYDIKADDDSLYADIKNKHNTVKGSNLKDLYKDLESYIKNSTNPNAKGYWVQIISSGNSFCKNWKIPSQNLSNPNIYKVSGDKFYEILTGNPNAFYEICTALPKVVDKVTSSLNMSELSKNTKVVEELMNKSDEQNTELLTQLFNETFSNYNGFPIINKK